MSPRKVTFYTYDDDPDDITDSVSSIGGYDIEVGEPEEFVLPSQRGKKSGGKFRKGDRIVVNQPEIAGEPNSWHGKHGVVTRTPGEEATSGVGPSGSYAVRLDGEEFDSAPFGDADLDLEVNPSILN